MKEGFSICFMGDNQPSSPNVESNFAAEVYWGHVNDALGAYHKSTKYLSKIELERLAKFRFESDRALYCISHALIRRQLSRLAGIPAPNIQFIRNAFGKPSIAHPTITFNISHSKDYYAAIISDGAEVGIDVEGGRTFKNYSSIMNKYYSEGEIMSVQSVSEDFRLLEFYRIWTRKEALLKAIGVGLIDDLKSLETSKDVNMIGSEILPVQFESYAPVYYIFSEQIADSYLSVSTSKKAKLNITKLDNCNWLNYID